MSLCPFHHLPGIRSRADCESRSEWTDGRLRVSGPCWQAGTYTHGHYPCFRESARHQSWRFSSFSDENTFGVELWLQVPVQKALLEYPKCVPLVCKANFEWVVWNCIPGPDLGADCPLRGSYGDHCLWHLQLLSVSFDGSPYIGEGPTPGQRLAGWKSF